MEGNKGKQPSAEGSSGGDWRAELARGQRQAILDEITEAFKFFWDVADAENLSQLKLKATQFDEDIYATASSLSDYVQKITLRLHSLKRSFACDALPLLLHVMSLWMRRTKTVGQTAATLGIQSQQENQGQPPTVPLVNQAPVMQPIFLQNLQQYQNAPIKISSSTLPPGSSIAGTSQSTIPHVGQCSVVHNISGGLQNKLSCSSRQGVDAGVPRQMPHWQREPISCRQDYILHRKRKRPHSQPHLAQQQQSLLHSTQKSSQQPPLMQIPSSVQPGQSRIPRRYHNIAVPFYLDVFLGNPEKLEAFLDIMRDIHRGNLKDPYLTDQKVMELLLDHPDILTKYKAIWGTRDRFGRVHLPGNQQPFPHQQETSSAAQHAVLSRQTQLLGSGDRRSIINAAFLAFLKKVLKTTHSSDREKYNKLMAVMARHRGSRIDSVELKREVAELFVGHPDIIADLYLFLHMQVARKLAFRICSRETTTAAGGARSMNGPPASHLKNNENIQRAKRINF